MRLAVCAVGRLKSGPEKALVDDYMARAGRTGRQLGLDVPAVIELDERKAGGGKSGEGALILRAIGDAAGVCALDERGTPMSSPDFARLIAARRDAGQREVMFVIGGADGLTDEVLARADERLSFGRMVWPHMLARVMLAEQIYRATQILAGTPYHRV